MFPLGNTHYKCMYSTISIVSQSRALQYPTSHCSINIHSHSTHTYTLLRKLRKHTVSGSIFAANSSRIETRSVSTNSCALRSHRSQSISSDLCLVKKKSPNSTIQGAQRSRESCLLRPTCLLNGAMSNNYLHTSPARGKLIQFNLADIGEGIREVTIKEWNPDVKVGARIAEFDTVCEVESDKASVSITSRYSGIVKKVFHGEGDVAFVGKPLIEIQVEDETSVEGNTSSKSSHEAAYDANESNHVNGEQTEVKQTNDLQNKLALDKQNVELARVEPSRVLSSLSSAANRQTTVHLNKNKWKVLATPSVRRMIKQYDIDTTELRGTGKQGRVLKEDIVHYMNSPVPDHSVQETSVIPIRGYVRGMFKSMTEANTIPTLRLTEEVDTTRLKQVKSEVAQLFQEKHALKLTFMPFFIKALSVCVTEYPLLNASIDAASDNILIHPDHNVCVAIDTPHGLVVPHLKRVNHLSLVSITRELLRLQASAHAGKVAPADLQGGTVSISNVGNVGGALVQPIIVPRQVCIVAFGRMLRLPRLDAEDCVVARSILNVTWAADHRVVDGATVARAATLYRELVENPMLLLTQ